MLRNFVERGIPVLGIDPANGPAKAAQAVGMGTLNTFFTRELAKKIRDEARAADVFLANMVVARAPDLNGFVARIGTLLKDTDVAVIECPYAVDQIDQCEFDTSYHRHLCYFSMSALDVLFRRHGLYVNEVRRLPMHDGLLRLFIEPRASVGVTVRSLLAEAKRRGVDRIEYYRDFSLRVWDITLSLMKLIADLKRQGKRIAAYGAAAKARP